MNEETVLSPHLVLAMASTCPATRNGWLWHCAVHDTHGSANSQAEAEHVAEAHRSFHQQASFQHRCNVVVWLRTEHERVLDI